MPRSADASLGYKRAEANGLAGQQLRIAPAVLSVASDASRRVGCVERSEMHHLATRMVDGAYRYAQCIQRGGDHAELSKTSRTPQYAMTP